MSTFPRVLFSYEFPKFTSSESLNWRGEDRTQSCCHKMNSHRLQCGRISLSSEPAKYNPSNEALHNLEISTRLHCASIHAKSRRCNARKRLNIVCNRVLRHHPLPNMSRTLQAKELRLMASRKKLHSAEETAILRKTPSRVGWERQPVRKAWRLPHPLQRQIFQDVCENCAGPMISLHHKAAHPWQLSDSKMQPVGSHYRRCRIACKIKAPQHKSAMNHRRTALSVLLKDKVLLATLDQHIDITPCRSPRLSVILLVLRRRRCPSKVRCVDHSQPHSLPKNRPKMDRQRAWSQIRTEHLGIRPYRIRATSQDLHASCNQRLPNCRRAIFRDRCAQLDLRRDKEPYRVRQ